MPAPPLFPLLPLLLLAPPAPPPPEEAELAAEARLGLVLRTVRGRNSEAHRLAADEAALEAARRSARLQVRDAKSRLDAAREAYDILDGQVVPQWQQAAKATQAAFASGQAADALAVLDASRGYLQVRLERVRALARLHGALGDLERAAGHLHGYSEAEEGRKP